MPAGEVPTLEVQAGPLPDSALEAIANARDAAVAAAQLTRDSLGQLRALAAPARPEYIELSPASPKCMSNARETAASIGLLNPNVGVAVWLGVGGLRADAGNGIPVPANRAVILPFGSEDVEVAADPAPGARVVVILLRFEVVQPFFVGAFA